jgi:hypothetical protein
MHVEDYLILEEGRIAGSVVQNSIDIAPTAFKGKIFVIHLLTKNLISQFEKNDLWETFVQCYFNAHSSTCVLASI